METKLIEWFNENFSDLKPLINDFTAGVKSNPGRITKAYKELFSGYKKKPENIFKVTLSLNEDYKGTVAALNIPFLSFCYHHFLPFNGVIDVIYEPGPFIIGIGKIPRVVHCRSQRFQIQEILVKEICEDFMKFAKAKGCFVRSKAIHHCVCYRGPKVFNVENECSYGLGTLENMVIK